MAPPMYSNLFLLASPWTAHLWEGRSASMALV